MDGKYSGCEIAIIGTSCRFPMSNSREELWGHLQAGKELISVFSDEELENEVEERVRISPNYVRAKGLIENALYFDTQLFGYSQREAAMTDPQHRILLECAWEVLEQSGYDPEQYSGTIGVFVGCNQNSYFLNKILPFLNQVTQNGHEELALLIGNSNDYLATRLSFKLNLKGPSKTIQTACSTSLVTVHDACQALLSFECDLALAGGASISFPLKSGYIYSQDSVHSSDGHCRAFDHRASGTVFGDGVGLVLLKRLEDAIRDCDTVLAVIRGSATNNDGADKIGFLAPSIQGQSKVIAAALAAANISAETISYIEAHGTGTALGDPIEIAALVDAFKLYTKKKQFCAIGSIKTNVGHLISAAGIASLIKTISMLNAREIPASLYFEKPNPNIPFSSGPFYVNSNLQSWVPETGLLRAGVSSFGMGGTNVHVILEEPPKAVASDSSLETYILPFSAATPSALTQIIQRMIEYLDKYDSFSLGDIAFTLQVGRRSMRHKVLFICKDLKDAKNQLYVYRLSGYKCPIVYPKFAELESSWLGGKKIDWSQFHDNRSFRRIPLPTYPFERVKCEMIADQNTKKNVHKLKKQPQPLIEKMISTLWAHILEEECFEAQSDFFSLGGDSLSALEMVDHLRELFCIDIKLQDFLANPTIKDLTILIDEKKKL